MADDRPEIELEFDPVPLEPACEWAAADVADPAQWTEHLSPTDYDTRFNLGLTDQEKNDLVEYLKSL